MVTATETTAQPENAEEIEELNRLIAEVYGVLPKPLTDVVQEYIDTGRQCVLIKEINYLKWWQFNGFSESQVTAESAAQEGDKIYDEKGNSLCGTYREVGGIVYEIGQGYGTGEDAKAQAMVEAHFQRECNNKYARAMKVIHGDYKGTWAIYVSLCNRGE